MTQKRLSSFFTSGISDEQYQSQLQNASTEHKSSSDVTVVMRTEQQAKKRLRQIAEAHQKRGPGRPKKEQAMRTISINNSNNNVTIAPSGDINIRTINISVNSDATPIAELGKKSEQVSESHSFC